MARGKLRGEGAPRDNGKNRTSRLIFRCCKAVLICWLVLLPTTPASPENRITLDRDPGCRIQAAATEEILALIDRISGAWESDDAEKLSAMIPNGSLSTPGQPTLSSRKEIKAAISKQLSRSIYKGSRLEIVVRCFERKNAIQERAAVRGNWMISRFYGQENVAGGTPMPPQLMPPTAGGFIASVVKQGTTWIVEDLRLKFDSTR